MTEQEELEMTGIDDTLCVAKIDNVTPTQCNISLIFNGGTSVEYVTIDIDEPAHMEVHEMYDYDVKGKIEVNVMVGEGGLKPFIDKLKVMYPNVMIVEAKYFNAMVEAQEQAAAMLVQ